MRGTLAEPSLARYAGQVVWLALDFDRPENAAFLARHTGVSTPTFYMIDPATETVTETVVGAMTAGGVAAFVERGIASRATQPAVPADIAFARAEQLAAGANPEAAPEAFRDAVALGGAAWPARGRAIASWIAALQVAGRNRECAELAATEAPRLPHDESLGRALAFGLGCIANEVGAPWTTEPYATLAALAPEALASPAIARDHRFSIYRWSIVVADQRGDHAATKQWGDRWIAELDAEAPATEDERTALDIARVEAADALHDPDRVLPALIASERAMPTSYVASLRLAQVQLSAKRYDDAIAACERGLQHVTGPLAKSWLLQLEAKAFVATGRRDEARRVLTLALAAARQIATEGARARNIANVEAAQHAL
jgi:tetratricopeptide (TPR) repeat protein